MVSKCCLKFLFNIICSYWINGALVNIIATSGSGIVVVVEESNFLDSNSFPKLVSNCSFIL